MLNLFKTIKNKFFNCFKTIKECLITKFKKLDLTKPKNLDLYPLLYLNAPEKLYFNINFIEINSIQMQAIIPADILLDPFIILKLDANFKAQYLLAKIHFIECEDIKYLKHIEFEDIKDILYIKYLKSEPVNACFIKNDKDLQTYLNKCLAIFYEIDKDIEILAISLSKNKDKIIKI
jgi:hypothetical protein